MNLTSFLLKATPWIGRMVLSQNTRDDISKKLQTLVYTITGDPTVGAYSKILNDKDLLAQYQLEAGKVKSAYFKYNCVDRQGARRRDAMVRRANTRNARADKMIYIAFTGLICSIGTLFLFKQYLSVEIISIISTIVSVLIACLRDIYVFEFGQAPNANMMNDKVSKFDF